MRTNQDALHQDIERLTRPWREKIMRDDGTVEIVMQAPLLARLKDAAIADIGGNGGPGKPLRERSPLGVSAADLFDRICFDADALYRGDPERLEDAFRVEAYDKRGELILLRTMYTEIAAAHFRRDARRHPERGMTVVGLIRRWGSESGSWDDWKRHLASQLTKAWVSPINQLLDPVARAELREACPVPGCGQIHYVTPQGTREYAIQIHWMRPVEKSWARCSACGAVWAGPRALAQLRYQINVRNETSTTPVVVHG